jgi:diadenylate cyclase
MNNDVDWCEAFFYIFVVERNMIGMIVNGFIAIRLLDIVDILLVAVILYEVYRLVRGTVAINIFLGILGIYFFWKLVKALDMELLSEIIGQFVSVGVIILIVVFQKEIRQFLLLLGTPRFIRERSRWFTFFKFNVKPQVILTIDPIIRACIEMSSSATGAIIVLSRRNELNEFINTGETVDSRISDSLIGNIFFKNSPLHDGAIIISRNRIVAARCILPLTRDENFPVSYGLRHRAAVGISEQTDAIAIVVSEQTGDIAYSKEGTLYTKIKPEALKVFLEAEFN